MCCYTLLWASMRQHHLTFNSKYAISHRSAIPVPVGSIALWLPNQKLKFLCGKCDFPRSLSLLFTRGNLVLTLFSFCHRNERIKDAISSNTNTSKNTFAHSFDVACIHKVSAKESKRKFSLNSFLLLFKFTRIFVASPASPYYFRLFYLISPVPNTRTPLQLMSR